MKPCLTSVYYTLSFGDVDIAIMPIIVFGGACNGLKFLSSDAKWQKFRFTSAANIKDLLQVLLICTMTTLT
jgi:hypothetical protein